jgi:hypothetical protein
LTPEEAVIVVERAQRPSDLFSPGEHVAQYRKLLGLVHPDRFAPAQRARAAEVAGKLAKFYHEIIGKPSSSPVIVGKWVVEAPFTKGDLADLYLVKREDAKEGILKIVRSETDNDLMDAEAQALKALWGKDPGDYRKYLPEIFDTFQASGRRANVFARYPGYFSLRQIRQMLDRVPARHIVWMMNRLLSAIGFSEREGYVHGGISPDHLLYHPETHGMVLTGWCSAVSIVDGQHIQILSDEWKEAGIYPEEVLRKWKCGAGTNVFMAAKSILWAAEEMPVRFRRLFEWCTATSPRARPQDAWEFQDLWRETAEQEYGKPKYLKLELPIQ